MFCGFGGAFFKVEILTTDFYGYPCSIRKLIDHKSSLPRILVWFSRIPIEVIDLSSGNPVPVCCGGWRKFISISRGPDAILNILCISITSWNCVNVLQQIINMFLGCTTFDFNKTSVLALCIACFFCI